MSVHDLPGPVPNGPLGHSADSPPPPGVTLDADGATFCVYAGHADGVEVCLFSGDRAAGTEQERRVPLRERLHGWWWGHVPDVRQGQRYALRARGPWDPDAGHRHNDAKLLLDPWAKAIEGSVDLVPAVYGHRVGEDLRGDDTVASDLDSAPHVPRCVVVSDDFDWGHARRPRTATADSIVYEVHVREATRLLDAVPEHLRGTYAGLAHPAFIEHLQSLRVTAVELLPVHAFTHEPHLALAGRTNHWGYNTLGFFAPHADYAAADDPQGVVDEFKGMVKLLHEAGIEVVLDVVYNHTAEKSVDGPTLSWRGLDGRAYYRFDERGRDVDVTGCGNTLDLTHPVVVRMVLDSLRYWVTVMGVDGFRFDLAVALGRGAGGGYDPNHPFLVALRTDPVLAHVKLVAEPWDLGDAGWRTGQFPPPFSEWNDRFRDGVRSFWLTDVRLDADGDSSTVGHGIRDIVTRLAGSEDLFWAHDRGPTSSVNFVTAHDGFTLADLTAYDVKHNEANGEDNRDGTTNNRSWNHGVEGPTDDEGIRAARRRSMRNLLGTLLLSAGVPMLRSGDEIGRSTDGNNNPYSQDNELSWLPWGRIEPWQEDLLATTRHLTMLRRALPALRRRRFFTGEPTPTGAPDVSWLRLDGEPMDDASWDDRATRSLQMLVDGEPDGSGSTLIVLHGAASDAAVRLPEHPGAARWRLAWDSAWERPDGEHAHRAPGEEHRVTATSLQVWLATHD